MNTDTRQPAALHESDPRLTAYALDEMDAGARAAYESEIRDNPAAQTAIAEIRAMARELETALAHEPVPAGTAASLGRDTSRAQAGRAPSDATEPDWRAAREAEAARARRAAAEDDPYAKRPWHFPYFLVAGLGLACFALLFFFARTSFRESEISKNQKQVADAAPNATTVIDGHTYKTLDLGSDETSGTSATAVVAATIVPATTITGTVDALALASAPMSAEKNKQEQAWEEVITATDALATVNAASSALATAPATAPAIPPAPGAAEGEVVQMSVFTVTAEADKGYQSVNTTSGSRLTTALKAPNVSIQPFSADFLNDVGATTVENLPAYAGNTASAGGKINSVAPGVTTLADSTLPPPAPQAPAQTAAPSNVTGANIYAIQSDNSVVLGAGALAGGTATGNYAAFGYSAAYYSGASGTNINAIGVNAAQNANDGYYITAGGGYAAQDATIYVNGVASQNISGAAYNIENSACLQSSGGWWDAGTLRLQDKTGNSGMTFGRTTATALSYGGAVFYNNTLIDGRTIDLDTTKITGDVTVNAGALVGGALVGNANSRTRGMPDATTTSAMIAGEESRLNEIRSQTNRRQLASSAPSSATPATRTYAYKSATVNIGDMQVVEYINGSQLYTFGRDTISLGNGATATGTTIIAFNAGSPRAPGGNGNIFFDAASGTLSNASINITTKPTYWGDTETYPVRPVNPFLLVAQNPLSTFSADVDTASYTNIRRFLNNGRRPPPDAVRIEEMLNYFTYDYATPTKNSAAPFAATMEVASAPWNPAHRLVRIGIKGRELDTLARPPASIVFLLDVSGSMDEPNKLSLVKESMRLLLGKLRPDDRVAIVTYAGTTGLALASTPVSHKAEILAVLDGLRANGSTNGGAGIQLAYDIAKANYIKNGANRVILCTDGDFNVGTVSPDALVRLIEEKAKGGVYLSVLGFGMGNLKDATLQRLADKGNGNYGYIDSREEARRQLVDRTDALINTIAKDVKLQVEFNPAQVAAYRLIGYEKRALAAQDFNNDKIDAGEIGAGHTVTALYEIIPASDANAANDTIDTTDTTDATSARVPPIDALKYQTQTVVTVTTTPKPDAAGELLTLKIRYKLPASDTSDKVEYTLKDEGGSFEAASADFKFASAVAAFGLLLRDAPGQPTYKGQATYDAVLAWGEPATGEDPTGQRAEFFDLVRRARQM